jgi:hypothetical protein
MGTDKEASTHDSHRALGDNNSEVDASSEDKK